MGNIELKIVTRTLRSQVSKSTRVTCTDPNKSTFDLVMKGFVQPLLDVQPQNAKLSGLVSQSKEMTLAVKSGSGETVTIESVTAQRGIIEVEYGPALTDDGYEFVVRSGPGQRPMLDRDVLKVRVRTPDGTVHETDVPITVEHLDRIVITPRNNVIFRREQTQALRTGSRQLVEQSVYLTGATPDITFGVTGVEIKDAPEGLYTARTDAIEEGKRYRVTIRVNQYSDQPTVRGTVVVHTDNPESPTQEIRLFAQFGDVPAPAAARPPVQAQPARTPPPAKAPQPRVKGEN